MNNIFKILSVFVICVVVASCSKSSSTDPEPIRDYATQYATEINLIDAYVDTHYMTVDPTSFDVTFTKIPTGGAQQSIRLQNQYPLKDTTVVEDGINYKIYFIKFREGIRDRPTQIDSVNVAYRGINIADATTGGEDVFDTAVTPTWFKLPDVITGWSHIIPNFKTGTATAGTGGNPATFNGFGAGVMFLPSGLAYYANSTGTIPAYSPIIFSFKLLSLQYRDQDADGIKSKDERKLDPSISSLIRWKENPAISIYKFDVSGNLIVDVPVLDTDGDGIPNAYDTDDDGDNFTTRSETVKAAVHITTTATLGHYPFDPTATEPNGIPGRTGTVGAYIYNYTSPTRLRKHLDPNWTPLN